MANIFRFLFLLLFARGCEPFSGGAPLSACNDGMVPRHGFSSQTGDPPVEILMDQARITPDTYLRVTLRSQKAFKGKIEKLDPLECNLYVFTLQVFYSVPRLEMIDTLARGTSRTWRTRPTCQSPSTSTVTTTCSPQ